MPRLPDLPPRLRRLVAPAIASIWEWTCRTGATGSGDRLSERFGAFGSGSCIAFPPGTVFGERWIHIGAGTMVGPYVTLSAGMVPGQAMLTDPVLRIGDRCRIGRGSHLVAHFSVDIGDDVHTGPYVYITDQNHGYEDPSTPIGLQWPHDDGVHIGSGTWLGTGAIILPGACIGDQVVVAAGSVVLGEVPDRCVVAGVPARIVRRYTQDDGWVRTTVPAQREHGPNLDNRGEVGAQPAQVAPLGPTLDHHNAV